MCIRHLIFKMTLLAREERQFKVIRSVEGLELKSSDDRRGVLPHGARLQLTSGLKMRFPYHPDCFLISPQIMAQQQI